MSLREAVLVVALVNHPGLIDENFDAVDRLELAHPELRRLQMAIVDAFAHDHAVNREGLVVAFTERGLTDLWERAVALVRKARQWPALEEAALDDARDAFMQALHLHRSAGFLHKELKAAEMALANDPTDENYRHLVEIQTQLKDVQATEALIEGFGVQSGRVARG